MKKKIPFSLEYKDRIESGEVEVVTRDDRHVDILKWDAKGKYPIITLITFEDGPQSPGTADEQGATLICSESMFDLFLLVEEEHTEFQALLQEFANMLFENYTDEDHTIFSSTLESWEKKFLEYAENQLEKKFRAECFMAGCARGKEEALKDMPKWKRATEDLQIGCFVWDEQRRIHLYMTGVRKGELYISMADILRLPCGPKEKEV